MATPLTFQYRVNGVLPPDAETTVTSVTIGITRDSDSAQILPAGSATSHPSAGTYTYDPTLLQLSSSLSYTVTWIYVDADGTHVATDKVEASDQTRTLKAYRQNVQYELGRFLTGTTTSSSLGTTDLICSALADSAGSVSQFDGWYLLVTSGVRSGDERAMPRAGVVPASGTLTVGRAFSTPLVTGVDFELASRLPATATGGVRGVNFAVNWALQRTWFRDRISLTPVANQRFYSLGPWSGWLNRGLRIGQLYTAPPDALSNPQRHWGAVQLRYDGELPMLELDTPFGATDTIFYLEVIRPGHTWTQSGGAWSETTQGLLQDSDQALVSPNLVTQLALVQCYRQLANTSVGADRTNWLGQAAAQAAGCAKLRTAMLEEFPRGAAEPARQLQLTSYPSFRF